MLKLKTYIFETPPLNKPLLMLIQKDGEPEIATWVVGFWGESGWSCQYNNIGYLVLEWYILPEVKYPKEKYSNLMRELEAFWNNQ